MTRLRTSDLREVVGFVGELNELVGDEPFPSDLLGRLPTLVPADSVAFNERDLVSRRLVAASGWCGEDCSVALDEWDDDPIETDAWEYVVHHPVNVHRRRTGYAGALADSDFWSRRARLRHDVFAPEYHAYWGLVDAVGVRLTDSSSHTASLWLESTERDFTERDKLVLDVLRPHLAARHRHVRLQRLLDDALAALETSPDDAESAAVVLVGPGGRVEFASPVALRLLDAYFGECGAGVPPALEEWRRLDSERPFQVRRDGHCLVVRSLGPRRSALLLHEEREPSVALTAREWDVMRWVEAGKTNDEIADLLFVTPATVKKHLEHVFEKLGVRSRTAAVAQLRPRLAPSARHDRGASAAER